MPDRLILIDSNIYIYHAWNTNPQSIINSHNQNANAAYGFAEFLLKLLLTEQPEHIICTFDTTRPHCIRKKIYPQYKANRSPAPEALRQQFAWCEEIAQALGIPCFKSEKYEADDLINTFAHHAKTHEMQSIILSADKDLAQILEHEDILWDHTKKHRHNRHDIRKRYQLQPSQIADMLALAGDKVDNIPGIPGVGNHGASRLLFKWGNLDTLYGNLDKASKMKFRGAAHTVELVKQHKNQVYLSRKLTGLFIDSSLPSDKTSMHIKPIDEDRLNSLFEKLAFSESRIKRWRQTLRIDQQ